MVRAIVATILLCLFAWAALARDDGRYANSPDREWFQAQLVPRGEHKGTSCCNSADGASAEEDIRNGEYWARFQTCDYSNPDQCIQVEWMRVPEDAVIDEPNKRGVATVWWYYDGGVAHIRCYAPGPKA